MHPAVRHPAVLATLLVCGLSPLAAASERVPLDHWSYPALDRFETLGLCTLPDARPWSRDDVRRIVVEVTARASGTVLSSRDRYELERLEREFVATDDPRRRYDPALYAEDGRVALEADFDARPYVEQAPFSDEVEAHVGADPTLKVHVGERVTFDVRYRLLFGPEHGDRARNEKPSRREKSFKGLTSLYDRSYAVAAWDPIELLVGRDHVDWGPEHDGGLIVPGERLSVDQIALRVRFRSMRLDAFYGQVFASPERYLVGHRLEGTFGRTVVGLSETVVFGGRGPDWMYLWPVSWYYANQFNERTNEDNILWSLDAKTSILSRVTLSASLLIDDFQFERNDGYPDKLAWDFGVRWVPARPLGLALRGSYRRVDIYTYSHLDSLSVYVSGAGELAQGDVLLGGAPGPDTDEWRIEAELFPRANLSVTLAGAGRRIGEGSDVRAFELGVDEPDPPFPSGVVETSLAAVLGVRWEFRGDSWVALTYGHQRVENRARVAGDDSNTDSFRLEIRRDIP